MSDMRAMTHSEDRKNLVSAPERVCEDHDSVVGTRGRDQAVATASLQDEESLGETAYLLRSPRNARRLREAVEQLRAGKANERELPAVT